MNNIVKKGFKVEGMTCKNCERIVKSQATSVDGVKDCWIDYATREGEVVFDPSKTDIDEILYKIEEKKGYTCFILKDKETPADTTGSEEERIIRMRFKVKDMECDKCEGVVKEQVDKVKGVESCTPNYSKRMVEVAFRPSETNIEEIMQAVEKKGYACEGFGDDAEETGSVSGNVDEETSDVIKMQLKVKGMHCTSCEETIEKQVMKIDGVKTCKADYAKQNVVVTFDNNKTNLDEIKEKIEEKQYECDSSTYDNDTQSKNSASARTCRIAYLKPAILTLALVAILFGGYQLVQGFAVFDLPAVGGPASLALLFGIGLLTGFHCVGMCGGFVMSYTAKNAADGRKSLHISSHAKYGIGKLLSYTAIGALFGLIGTIFVFTPLLKGAASIFAGIFLVLFGINTLNVFPAMRRVHIPMPRAVSKFVFAKSDRQNRPLVTGLLNGLMIACGPLQALYIYAAGTGSVASGALALFAFGLGTLPVMFGFGMFASYVSKNMTRNILKVSGLIVIVLGLVMLNRGLTLMGTGYDLNSVAASFIPIVQAGNVGGGAIVNGSYQEIRMNVTSAGWVPDRFVLKAGVPVKWIINGKEITGCNKGIQVPKLGLNFDIKPGEQVIEFTPPNEDTVIPWSCWMGMIQGTFVVKKDIDTGNQQQVQQVLQNTPAPARTSGCGCGGGGAGATCGG